MSRFKFRDVAAGFDHHIARSIPGYGELIETILQMSRAFIQDHGRVYDLGCSTGALLKAIEARHETVELIGYDIEPAFAKHWHRHYFQVADIRQQRIEFACLALSLFTLQFLPPADRQDILTRVYDGLLPGGALIIAEKTHFATGQVQELASTTYHQAKRRHFTDEEIMDKSAALVPVMRPSTGAEILAQLNAAGFEVVEPIWQRLHFRAWLAIKSKRA